MMPSSHLASKQRKRLKYLRLSRRTTCRGPSESSKIDVVNRWRFQNSSNLRVGSIISSLCISLELKSAPQYYLFSGSSMALYKMHVDRHGRESCQYRAAYIMRLP